MLVLSSNKLGDEGAASISLFMAHSKALALRSCYRTHSGVAALVLAAMTAHGKICHTFIKICWIFRTLTDSQFDRILINVPKNEAW